MAGHQKIFRQRLLYAPLVQNLLGKAVKEIYLDEEGIIFKTRQNEQRYLWTQIERVELVTGTIRGGYPGTSAVMKRTLLITTADRNYKFDVSPHRSQIDNHAELIKELEKHVRVRKTSSD